MPGNDIGGRPKEDEIKVVESIFILSCKFLHEKGRTDVVKKDSQNEVKRN